MNCAELDILLCDYVDGTMEAAAAEELERHLAGCPRCAEMARDIQAVVGFIAKTERVEPPPELLTRIVFELPRSTPAARERGGVSAWVRGWLHPVLQPRFAMGFAMTILSFSLLSRAAGINPRQLTLDDFSPAKVWQALDDRIYRGWQRSVKFYENIRFVYEIQTQLREWSQRDQDGRTRTAEEPAASGGAQGTSGREQRKANGR
jgi:hypothetical protein